MLGLVTLYPLIEGGMTDQKSFMLVRSEKVFMEKGKMQSLNPMCTIEQVISTNQTRAQDPFYLELIIMNNLLLTMAIQARRAHSRFNIFSILGRCQCLGRGRRRR
jgi:hypothetical protein